MKTVRELYHRLSKQEDFDKRFPSLSFQDGKTHVLFLAGILSPSGFHRMIQPALELNRTRTHAAIVANVCKWDFTKRFEHHTFPIDERLVYWADFLVIPAVFSDLAKLEALKELNPQLRIVMDVDLCYHELPAQHPMKATLSADALDQLLVNMLAVDLVTTPTARLTEYYERLLVSAFRYSEAKLGQYPNLLSDTGFPANFPLKRNTGERVRIGVLTSPTEPGQLAPCLPALQEIQSKLGDRVELLLLGWSSKHAKPEGLEVETVSPMSILDYYAKLNALKLDIGVLPADSTDYAWCKSDIKYLELCALGIPTIAQDQAPYSNMIRQGDNGLLASNTKEWAAAINDLVENEQQRESIGSYGFRFAWRNLAWNRLKRSMLADLFSAATIGHQTKDR